MTEDRFIISAPVQALELFNNLNSSTSNDLNEISLKSDLFCLFYLQNPVIKHLEEIPTELWMNYFLLEGLNEHYSFKNIQSYTKDHPEDSYWIADRIFSGFKTFKANKKIEKFIVSSYTFLIESKNMDFDDLIIEKQTREIKKQIRAILSNILVSLNGFLRKIEPILALTRGHDIAPLSFHQIDEPRLLHLAEKLQNPKFREIVKAFNHTNIKDTQEAAMSIKKDEVQPENIFNNIFYINDATQEQKDIYKNWLCKEIKEYRKGKIYKTQLTAYIKAGNLNSKTDEVETLSFALSILEVARLEKRNFNVIISKDDLGDKTFIFKNNDEVEIFENDQSYKFPALDGLISFITDLFSGPIPPKPKFSLNLSFSSKPKTDTGKKKVFKKPPTYIKFSFL